MAQNGQIFRYVMLVYAFAFVAALTLDTDRSISSWNAGASMSIQTVPLVPPRPPGVQIEDAVGITVSPAAEKDI